MLFRRGLKRILILKARQIGFLDFAWRHLCGPALLATGKQVSLVDKTQEAHARS